MRVPPFGEDGAAAGPDDRAGFCWGLPLRSTTPAPSRRFPGSRASGSVVACGARCRRRRPLASAAIRSRYVPSSSSPLYWPARASAGRPCESSIAAGIRPATTRPRTDTLLPARLCTRAACPARPRSRCRCRRPTCPRCRSKQNRRRRLRHRPLSARLPRRSTLMPKERCPRRAAEGGRSCPVPPHPKRLRLAARRRSWPTPSRSYAAMAFGGARCARLLSRAVSSGAPRARGGGPAHRSLAAGGPHRAGVGGARSLCPDEAPGRNEWRVVRGELRAAAGRWRDAEVDFSATLGRLADVPGDLAERALWGRAVARARSGDPVRAESDYALYLARFPSGGSPKVHLGAPARGLRDLLGP